MENNIAKSLLKAQLEMPKLEKDQENPFFKSKYVTLDQVLNKVVPILNKNGIILSQSVSFAEDLNPTLVTQLIHESGERLASEMLLQVKTADPQAQGSAITYARRYALVSMLGLSVGEDDDGNAATANQAMQEEQTRMQTSPIAIKGFYATLKSRGVGDKQKAERILGLVDKGWKQLNTSGIARVQKELEALSPDTIELLLESEEV